MITDPKVFLNDTTWKDKTIEGSVFPGRPYEFKPIILNKWVVNEYLKELSKFDISKGLSLWATAHTHQEGFKPGTRAYETKNPGNIGNVDSGANKFMPTLYDGVAFQLKTLNRIVKGEIDAYKIGRKVNFKPIYNTEIAKNTVTYQKSPWQPGYNYTYTGKLQEFLKIYATGPRSGNIYEYTIRSYFQQNGIIITGETTLSEIINIK